MHGTTIVDSAVLTTLRELPDRELIARVRAGEQRAFEPIMRRYNRRLFRAARGIVRSDADAEDVVQETYVRAYLHLGEFRGPYGLGAWLTRIAINEALMRGRRSATVDPPSWEEFDDDSLHGGEMMPEGGYVSPATPEEVAARGQLGGLLERCIDRLPEAYRLTFILREVEQLSVAEVAASLDVSAVTVKTRVHRARRLLRKTLSREFRKATAQAYPFAGQRCDRTVDAVFHRLSGSAGALDSGEPCH